MLDIVTGSQMKAIESKWINEMGIPSIALMESAANAIAGAIRKRYSKDKKVLVIANTGNNGGDALAIGRLLIQSGYTVSAVAIGNLEKATDECKAQYELLKKINKNVFKDSNIDFDKYDIIVDGIFGIGLTREITGEYAQIIERINVTNASVVSVDIPSGINADNGKVMGVSVQADVTVELGIRKLGNHLYPGCEYSGEVIYSDIGLNNIWDFNTIKIATNEDIEGILPKRRNDTNKGSYGKVLCICGSFNMAGAAVLSSTAAYRTGAGLVKVFSDYRNREIIQRSIPEALFASYDDKNDIEDELIKSLDWADSVLVGCGLGQDEMAEKLLESTLAYFVKNSNTGNDSNIFKKLILDADALNILSRRVDLVAKLPEKAIITPHIMEMCRLTGKSVSEIKENRFEVAGEFARANNCVVVLKDSRTVIASGDGRINLNTNGNNGMSTGGSGDVLAGMIATLSVSVEDAFESALAGVFMHGLSADLSIGKNTYETLISSDIYGGISSAYKLVTNDNK